MCSGVVQPPVLCPCSLVQRAGLQNVLWGCSAASAVSVQPCTGGRTAECALGLFSRQCCVRAALYRGQDCRMCSGVVQPPVLCPCSLVQRAGLPNVLWGCSAASAVSVQPCTEGRTAECALGLFSRQCCVRAALYRGQDCRMCSGVVQPPVLCPCSLVQRAGLQNVLWGCSAISHQCCVRAALYRGQDCRMCSGVVQPSATSAVSVQPCTEGRTAECALGLFSHQCCVRAALYRGQDCRMCSGVVQPPVLCLCSLVQRAGLQNVLWGCSATSAVSVQPCTEGRTAECALGLFSHQCCVRAALYRGQDCRMCSGVVQPPVLCPCSLVQRAGLQNVLWGCSAASAVSVQPCTEGRTAECALGLFSRQCCVRAALYRGQAYRTCSRVCEPVSHGSV